jgi:hypothetical protein
MRLPSPEGQRRWDRAYQLLLVGQQQLGQTKEMVMRTAFYVRVSTEWQQEAQTIEQQVALFAQLRSIRARISCLPAPG